MSEDRRRGLRELAPDQTDDLPGLWVAGGISDAPSEAPSSLGWHLIFDDAVLLGAALDRRGASLPRLSRRFVRVAGHGYHAFTPLARAARSLVSLDAGALALGVAAEARMDAERLAPNRAHLSSLGLGQVLLRVRRGLVKLERRVFEHERDAAQHYRWLVEMDLGILPDDALGTTLEECLAIQRATRGLELEATLDLLGTYAVLSSYAQRHPELGLESLAAAVLVPDPLELPSATPALAFTSAAQLERHRAAVAGERRARLPFREFLEAFGERGPGERDPICPRWRDRPEWLARLAELHERAGVQAIEQRVSRARHDREAMLARALSRLGAVDAALLRALLHAAKKLVLLRSRLHLVRARTLAMLRIAVLDVDRRLARLIGSEPNGAFFLELGELLDSTVRPQPELALRAHERQRFWTERRATGAPSALLGRGVRALEPDAPLRGVGMNGPEIVAPAFVARDFEHALELPPSAVLVTRALDVGWAPLLLAAGAVVTDSGGLTDEAALTAASLGVPLVLGTREGTRRLTTGTLLHVDTVNGTVVPA